VGLTPDGSSGRPFDLPPRTDLTALDAIAEEAQSSLRDRRPVSIRIRLGVGFAIWIGLSIALTVASLFLIDRVRDKLFVLEATSSYTFEVQQARRFEKNFFLYCADLDQALAHVDRAEEILNEKRDSIVDVVGSARFDTISDHLSQYRLLLGELSGHEPCVAVEMPPALAEIEAGLREHGSAMVSNAHEVMARERSQVNSMLTFSQRVPLALLVLLALSIGFLVLFIRRQMLAPLDRMVNVARRVAEGDLTMVKGMRRYRDEFSELAMAMNHMMYQLHVRQDMLVNAHKLKAVGTLTAGVAHELNNPINNIMLTAELLREDYADYSDADRLDMVQDLVGESERAQRIVRNLLDFARESGSEAEALDVAEIVDDTLQLATNQFKLANVKVNVDGRPDLPSVYGDAQQLEQVFLNIVLNAIDAMPDGGRLDISIGLTGDREYLEVDFEDTGTGIPPHKMNDIFDPFFTSKKRGKGTGLGLALSLDILKRHGGDIQVRSEVGRGTTFTVVLPVAKVPADLSNPIE
jgi:signal transduction histidine kinase